MAFAFFDLLTLPVPIVLVAATLAPGLPGYGFFGAASALAGFFSLLPYFLRVQSGGLFSFRLLVPGRLVYATRLALFLWGSLGRWRLSGLFLPGFRLPDLPGFFLVFRLGYLEAVLESSFFRKGMGG